MATASVFPVTPGFLPRSVVIVPSSVRPGIVLATCCLSMFLVTMDVTIVNVALPAIGRDLHAARSGLQWAIDSYTIVIASFFVLAGSLGDRFGRRRVFQVGLTVFGAGSLLCSCASTIEQLVAARIVQGIGGTMLNPIAMSIIVNVFTDPKRLAQAIGIWSAVFGVSMAAGPVLGGYLVEHAGWQSVFWINVPIAAIAIPLTRTFVPESRAKRSRRIDVVGLGLIVVGLATLTSCLIEGRGAGWSSPPIVAGFIVAACAFVALVAYERRRPEPLIDPRFFRSVPFSISTILAVIAFAIFSGELFLAALYLQEARGLSPQHAGMCLLPIAAALLTCAPLSGRMVGAGRARWALVVAGTCFLAGALLLVPLATDTPLVQVVAALALFGIGFGFVNAPITAAAVAGMPRAQAGVASALAYTGRQVGVLLGVALSGTIAGAVAKSPQFAASTHPYWWLIAIGGSCIAILGVVATGERARRSVLAVSPLVD